MSTFLTSFLPKVITEVIPKHVSRNEETGSDNKKLFYLYEGTPSLEITSRVSIDQEKWKTRTPSKRQRWVKTLNHPGTLVITGYSVPVFITHSEMTITLWRS